MRTLQLVGVIRNHKLIRLASQCAWCRKWKSRADWIAAHRDGAKVSHGICDACFAKQMAALDALDDRTPAA